MIIATTFIIIYIIGILLYSMRTPAESDVASFTVHSRKASAADTSISIIATIAGGAVTLGLLSTAYKDGVVAFILGIATILGLLLLYLLCPYIREYAAKNNVYSFEDYFFRRFNSKVLVGLVTAINFTVFFPLAAVQLSGITAIIMGIFESSGVSLDTIIMRESIYGGIVLIVLLYCTKLGLPGVYKTDRWQLLLMFFAIIFILVPLCFTHIGSLKTLPNIVDKNYLTGLTYGPYFLVGVALFGVPAMIVRIDLWQRIYSAKKTSSARKGVIWAIVGSLCFYLVFPLIGMLARAKFPDLDEPRDAAINVLSSFLSERPYSLALVLLALIAALMSTADSFLNLLSISGVRLIFKKKWEEWTSGDSIAKSKLNPFLIKKLHYSTISIGLLCALIARFVSIVDLMIIGLSAVMILLPAFLTGLFAKKITKLQITSTEIGTGMGLFTFIAFLSMGYTQVAFVPAVIIAFLINFFPPLVRNVYCKFKRNQ